MTDPVRQTLELGAQWPTIDPFLFCVHHDDAYPAGQRAARARRRRSTGRDLGMDFAGIDGWRMYHGREVPGFPQHPHRGFETVTYVRKGLIDHSDSLGAAARFGRGDVQWLTAGGGIVHSEMFPLLDAERAEPARAVPDLAEPPGRATSSSTPHFTMLWDGDIPRVVVGDDGRDDDDHGDRRRARRRSRRPPPPPHSWASRPDADVAIWHVALEPGRARGRCRRRPAPTRFARSTCSTAQTLSIDGHDERIAGRHRRRASTRDAPTSSSRAPDGAEVLVLQGRPIGEPVAQYGPFVMNTRAEIEQAFADYRSTQFGGWPWPTDDPVHRTRTRPLRPPRRRPGRRSRRLSETQPKPLRQPLQQPRQRGGTGRPWKSPISDTCTRSPASLRANSLSLSR